MRQLKVSHIILITYLLLSSCEQEHEKNLASNLAQINLEFLDYNKNLHKSFLDITIENGVAPIKEQLKIDDNGTASYSFINDKTREILISFEDRKFSQFISPGEALNAELVINELLEYKSNLIHSKTVSGANIGTNNLILNYTYTLDSLINNSTAGTSNNGTVSEMEYQEVRLTQMRNQLDELKSLLENNKISNKAFINWCKAQINYRAGYDLSLYPFMQINRSIDDKSPYFDFTNKISKDSEIKYLSHLNYLKTLSTSFKIISRASDKYSTQREVLEQDSLSYFPIEFEILKRFPNTTEREILMAFSSKNGKEIPQSYLENMKHFLNADLLAQIEAVQKDESQNIITLLKKYDISENEKSQLLELYEKLKGKVIYHDFWFANCGNCMNELPYYNDLIDQLDSNQVEFLFLGVFMEDEEWKKSIRERQLKGTHHLLTKNQLAFYEKYFEVYGFPHHQIVNSKSQIGDKSLFRAHPHNHHKITSLIQAHY